MRRRLGNGGDIKLRDKVGSRFIAEPTETAVAITMGVWVDAGAKRPRGSKIHEQASL
jgi:hypothetical protein